MIKYSVRGLVFFFTMHAWGMLQTEKNGFKKNIELKVVKQNFETNTHGILYSRIIKNDKIIIIKKKWSRLGDNKEIYQPLFCSTYAYYSPEYITEKFGIQLSKINENYEFKSVKDAALFFEKAKNELLSPDVIIIKTSGKKRRINKALAVWHLLNGTQDPINCPRRTSNDKEKKRISGEKRKSDELLVPNDSFIDEVIEKKNYEKITSETTNKKSKDEINYSFKGKIKILGGNLNGRFLIIPETETVEFRTMYFKDTSSESKYRRNKFEEDSDSDRFD